MPNTFAIWVRLCFLHLWLVDVRFRSVGALRDNPHLLLQLYCLFIILADPWTKHRMQQKLMNYLWQDIESGIMETLVRLVSPSCLLLLTVSDLMPCRARRIR